jgi:hypothetical protein
VFTFNGTTTVDQFTSGNVGTIIDGTGEVTITKVLGPTTSNTVIIKNTGGVTLTAENTLAANLKATKATIVGDVGGTGVTIKSDNASLTVPTGATITVSGTGSSIVAGGGNATVTITGATLKAGTYTAANNATNTLKLVAATEIEVADGGEVAIGTAGQIVFTADTSKISLLAGGSLVSSLGGTLIKDSNTVANVKLIVGTTASPTTPTTAAVTTANTTEFTVTTGTGSGSTDVTVANAKWTIATGAVDTKAVSNTGTAGKLKAGAGTTLTLTAAS